MTKAPGINKDIGLTDEMLFEAFQKGDATAFDVLLEKYQGMLYSYILRFIPDRAKAQDVLQDVFMKVFEKKDQFHKSISLKAWFYTLCRNTCIDAFRKQKRLSEINPAEVMQTEFLTQAGALNPQQVAQDKQLSAFLKEALLQIPEEQKETFNLKVVEDLTFEEIAEVMQCSVNTAKSRMRYAVEVLRTLFMKRGYLK